MNDCIHRWLGQIMVASGPSPFQTRASADMTLIYPKALKRIGILRYENSARSLDP
jgi:hypothetical protein